MSCPNPVMAITPLSDEAPADEAVSAVEPTSANADEALPMALVVGGSGSNGPGEGPPMTEPVPLGPL